MIQGWFIELNSFTHCEYSSGREVYYNGLYGLNQDLSNYDDSLTLTVL